MVQEAQESRPSLSRRHRSSGVFVGEPLRDEEDEDVIWRVEVSFKGTYSISQHDKKTLVALEA